MSTIFTLLCLLLLPLITSSPTHITLSLHPIPHSPPPPHPSQALLSLSSASLSRALHLKRPPPAPSTSSHEHPPLSTNLFPHSYGAYSINLHFGTPPQPSSLVMDTGSSLVWSPCTHSYSCKNCTFPNSLPTPTFLPKSSSSAKLIGCTNPKCSLLYPLDSLHSRCPECRPNSPPSTCSQVCPSYILIYGSGLTAGFLLSETLLFPKAKFSNFGLGCSVFASGMPAGIAGFGRGPLSLPAQLSLDRFAYCLLSHRFDNSGNSSSLILDLKGHSRRAPGVSYTPFMKNPIAGNPAFSDYYYVGLRKISVGRKTVKIPYQFTRPGPDGSGGTIVDSGTTFTYMDSHVFEPIERELVAQVGDRYKRVSEIESGTGLRPCFDVSGGANLDLPKLTFHFKGGANMDLPLPNYFSLVGAHDVACLTIVTGVEALREGPSIILGNFQQQNFHIEYNLKQEEFGFRQQMC